MRLMHDSTGSGIDPQVWRALTLKISPWPHALYVFPPAGALRGSMRPAFEQIDEAAGKARLGAAAGIDGHEVAHGAGERKAINLPYAERCPQPIANLDQDNLVTAAAFARRVCVFRWIVNAESGRS
jgi:hypothetical protein